MKHALIIRNVSSHDVPLDNLDDACVQACNREGFVTKLAVNDEHDVMHHLTQTHTRSITNNDRRFYQQTPSARAPFDVVLFRASGLSERRLYSLLQTIRNNSKQIFLCVFSPQLAEHPMARYQCFQEGASMVTESLDAVRDVLAFIASCGQENGNNYHLRRKSRGRSGGRDGFTCPFCNMNDMNEDQLWRHCPLYHINEKNTDGINCPICRETPRGPFQVHMYNAHGPPGRHEMTSEFHMADSTLYSFALVVCHNKKYNRFLLVQEFANSGYWLPGGRIDSGENPAEAAIRETKEEAGIDICLTGVLKLEYHPKQDRNGSEYVRMRFIFYAEPLDCDQPPKSIPDYESAGATWCQADQVASLPLRGNEPIKYFDHIVSGKPVYPLDLIYMTSSS
ncbi:nudix domain containing protein [Plasmopara halstedii]|uniref:Nudix domain containing protein n=1 Tax=Plasmopara halstedii TaxID=4781 RepID=A0A0P1AZN7_PLAHL|nr:nudix domain containing protein [Plasmopara halstedii]CEG46388.1 nudix domain containing protein [Plasmopara halstedii]|eukprot:XP_024582757.1 nudix domain containing protein [Plasmopara halstedii]